MQVFIFRNFTHILTRTHEKKFQDMFLVKIENKGTSLSYKYEHMQPNYSVKSMWSSFLRVALCYQSNVTKHVIL